MKEPTLVTVWRPDRKAGRQVRFHRHSYYELVYYARGAGVTCIGESNWDFAASTYALISPQVFHNEIHHADGVLLCLGFQTEEQLPSGLFRDTGGSIYRIVNTLLAEFVEQKPRYREMITAKLTELLIELHRTANAQPMVGSPKNFAYAVNYLTENYYEKINFSELAAALNVSYDYFQHRFKQITGVSPRQFLLRKRLDSAKTLLCSSDFSCTEIAYQCGFSNSAQFAMLFKRELGITPLQYRSKKDAPSSASLLQTE